MAFCKRCCFDSCQCPWAAEDVEEFVGVPVDGTPTEKLTVRLSVAHAIVAAITKGHPFGIELERSVAAIAACAGVTLRPRRCPDAPPETLLRYAVTLTTGSRIAFPVLLADLGSAALLTFTRLTDVIREKAAEIPLAAAPSTPPSVPSE